MGPCSVRVVSFRWSWTANATDLSSAQTFSPIMVPLLSAGLIPINELSRNEGGFCNSVCAAPSGCDQILFSFNHGVGLTLFRSTLCVGGGAERMSKNTQSGILCGWIQKRPLGQQERLCRIQKHKPRNTHKQAQASRQLRELFWVWWLAL